MSGDYDLTTALGEMSTPWFRAILRFKVLVKDDGALNSYRSIVLFRALDWAAAKAVSLGHCVEQTYVGGWRTAALSNGTKVTVRPSSSGGEPTLSMATPGNPIIKIRY